MADSIRKMDDLPDSLEKEVEQKVNAEIGEEDYFGRCHTFWAVKKRILLEEYGIDWRTPAEQYPTIFFD